MDAGVMTNSGYEAGARVRVSDGVQDAGRCGTVVGNEAFAGQWWCPVLWDDAEDPDFNKSGCLEPLGAVTPEDWREVLRELTRLMIAAEPARQDHLMEIVGKIGSGDTGGLDDGDLEEIRCSLEADAGNCIDGGVRLRSIVGKIGPGSGRPKPKLRLCMEDVLARLYVDKDRGQVRTAVAKLCDEELDRSGALLRRVRLAAEKLGA